MQADADSVLMSCLAPRISSNNWFRHEENHYCIQSPARQCRENH